MMHLSGFCSSLPSPNSTCSRACPPTAAVPLSPSYLSARRLCSAQGASTSGRSEQPRALTPLRTERRALRRVLQPLRSLMWDSTGGDMTLSEQLLSLREHDSMDEGEMPMATVNFHLRYKTNFGQGVKLIGSDPKLGNWDIRYALEMTYTPGDQWVASVDLAAGGVYEYKYVIINYETKEALEWQNGSNAVLAIIADDTEVEVFDNWGNNPGAMVRINNESITREGKLQRWAGYMGGFWKEAKRLQGELMQKNGENQGLRNELSQLRMELSLEQQARSEAMSQMKELKVENASLKNRLAQKTVELNRTLTEVLDMLDAGMLDGEDVLNMKNNSGTSSEEEEDAQWLAQRGMHVNGASSYGSSNDYSSSYSTRDYGSSYSNGGYQARPSDMLFGEVAAEGQGMGQPKKPLVGWEAEAEAQARAAELGQYGRSNGNGNSSASSTDYSSSWYSSSLEEEDATPPPSYSASPKRPPVVW